MSSLGESDQPNESGQDHDDQEVVIGSSSGRAILVGNGEEIVLDEVVENSHAKPGMCPTWLRSSSPKMKCALITATLMFVAFVSITVVGILESSKGSVDSSETFTSAQYQETISTDPNNESKNDLMNPPSPRPSDKSSEIMAIPIESSQISIRFPDEIEQKLQQIDFTDGLTSVERSNWKRIQEVIGQTIAVTLFEDLPSDYVLGTIEIEEIDGNELRSRDDITSFNDKVHTVMFSSSVIVDCTMTDCDAASDTVRETIDRIGQKGVIDAVGQFESVASTATPANTDNVDATDQVDATDEAVTSTTSTEVTDEVDVVDTLDMTNAADTSSPTINPTKPPVTESPSYRPTDAGPQYLDDATCSSSSPCDECFGSCSSDEDCAQDLLCFKRLYWDNVPGCEGPGRQGQSYCYNPFADGLTKDVLLTTKDMKCGNNNPCGKCEGDCNSDNDCDKNLYCYQRFGYELIPGCAGQGTYQYDYCFDPNDIPDQNEPNADPNGDGGPGSNGRPN
ncbi:hypothetical protein HJC23_013934 [Cyclotella cryptica]|uniref:Uncharacterized protein n=1 Tax=Cyclotella cryptica TaxID=29204 RepID=A0ABD3NNL9_9STRA|eukprot:CCRYP_020479-RB/>CCRYP_020479-RB protein AED:0.04 eAED:0.04 QI:290/1/1/1/0.5/0.33/3/250/506